MEQLAAQLWEMWPSGVFLHPRRTDRSLELTSVYHECPPGRWKVAVKVVDIFGTDTMSIVEVTVGGKK